MIYFLFETQKKMMFPYAQYLKNSLDWFKHLPQTPFTNMLQAKNELTYEFIRDYPKPHFSIHTIEKSGITHEVSETVVLDEVFCELRFFKKTPELDKKIPLLIVAPLSGHYATLLRDTVKSSLSDFDVFVTDWKNCRDIPMSEGEFGFDDYVLYVEKFISHIKQEYGQVHVLAVCQPTVPVLCAVAHMEKNNHPDLPESITLMGGPIDTRQSPTEVNKYALKNDLDWFKNNVIYPVPLYYKGMGREVYPGFLQYSGFVAMNFKRHTEAHVDFFNNLLIGADLDANKHRKFYEEYNSVMDLPAKYYLETLERVFIDQYLAKDKMTIEGQPISLKDIKKTRILTIEGELDDISGTNQTHVVIDLTTSLKKTSKKKVTVPKVGHYGIFAGKTWREVIYPQVYEFATKN